MHLARVSTLSGIISRTYIPQYCRDQHKSYRSEIHDLALLQSSKSISRQIVRVFFLFSGGEIADDAFGDCPNFSTFEVEFPFELLSVLCVSIISELNTSIYLF